MAFAAYRQRTAARTSTKSPLLNATYASGVLAVELALPDLDDLADTMRLSGAEGVEVYETLRSRSSSMRQARLTAELAQANAIGERMGIPVPLMGLSIALIVVVAVIMNLVVH